MAAYLLRKHPEVLLGGGSLETCADRCSGFWANFKYYQPNHKVFSEFSPEALERVIPICCHGDKGRTLKKSPIACYSWESIWGIPEHLRMDDPKELRQLRRKYDTGSLGKTCGERGLGEPDDACTIKRRRLGMDGNWIETHNSWGCLVEKQTLKFQLRSFIPHTLFVYSSAVVRIQFGQHPHSRKSLA